MKRRWYSKSVCALLAGAMVVGNLPGVPAQVYAEESGRVEAAEKDGEDSRSENSLIAEIDFDGKKISASDGVKVDVKGTEKYSSDTRDGSGEAFDFNRSTYLDLKYEDGQSLVSGHDALTFYYESKPTASSTSWSLFAAANANSQSYLHERYIGALDQKNSMKIERYLSDGVRAEALDYNNSGSDWKAVAIVMDKDSYSLYVNGEKKKTVSSSIPLEDILGENGILQIGKGNWGNGEFYGGLIDNIKVFGEALSDEEIAELSKTEEKPEVEKTTEEKLAEDVEALSIHDADDVRGNIYLPLKGKNGSEISWKSSDSSVVTDKEKDGKAAGVVKRGDEDVKVTLTASLSLEGNTDTKDIEVTVKAKNRRDKDYSAGYLWAYFSAYDKYERMFLGYSEDGLNWTALNADENGRAKPILSNDGEGSDLGVRDPHIVRSPEGDRYWIIGTDLHAEGGGDGGSGWNQTSASQKIVVWESTDLTDWSDAELVFAGMDTAGCVWAPEAIYDEEKGDYLVYWSARDASLVGTNDNALRVYYTRTRDFRNFEEPKLWLSEDDPSSKEVNIIDTTIVKDNDKFYRFSTSDWNTVIDRSDSLATDLFDVNVDKDKSAEGNWTRLVHRDEASKAGFSRREGFTVYQLPDGRWCAMGDDGGYAPFVTDDLSSAKFEQLSSSKYSFTERFRHGTVIRLSKEEEKKVLETYPLTYEPEKEEINPDITGKETIAEFDFNDKENGFSSEYTKAEGDCKLGDSWDGTKAAYFDGTDDFLTVKSTGDKNAFKGQKELTISYENKIDKSGTGWVAYASNSSDAPKNQYEQYIGVFVNDTVTKLERFLNSGSRPGSASASTDNDWAHVDIVLSEDDTKIYVNGKIAAEEASSIDIADILGKTPVFQIGKANWGSGEYYKGWIDNFKVSNWAFSEEEVKKSAAAFAETLPMISGATIGSAPDRATALEYRGTDNHTSILTNVDHDKKLISSYVNNDQDLKECPVTLDFALDAREIKVNGKTFENGGKLDLTNGASLEIGEGEDKEIWTVKKPVLCNNTVISGQYADPDIDYFDGKFWIFPTTDGYKGWSGYLFHAFSSENLVDWKDEGVIMDLQATESYKNENGVDVATSDWAFGSAWAPTIEKKNGKYYFYYCGKDASGTSSIGVAVADKPEGPYKDYGEPILTKELCKENGVGMGQAIDPSVFTDDNGKSYITFGNGKAVIAELADDMIHVEKLTQVEGLSDFRESLVVVKANGKYHWTWSCDDANSENYHVNYAVTDSLFDANGRCRVSNVKTNFLYKNTDLKILGCAHQSLVSANDADGKEHWYMAYHRFYTPTGIFNESDGLGVHRETCVDEVSFDEDGNMQIRPTLEGVSEFKTKPSSEE